MKLRILLMTAAGLVGAIASLYGQNAAPNTTGSRTLQIFGVRLDTLEPGFSNELVTGKPFSATEERHSLQALTDGTRIETRQTTRLFRDSEGRTRMEDVNAAAQPSPGFEFGPITITDPVASTRVALNPRNLTKLTAPFTPVQIRTVARLNGQPLIQQKEGGVTRVENLETKSVNGVMARGERTTTTIPTGAIGNNREIHIVTERWVSDDLQMLIKSTNSDPRFGDTEYQLTGVIPGEPNASLFQVPSGYTESSGGRGRGIGSGGARGGVAAPGGRGKGIGAKQP